MHLDIGVPTPAAIVRRWRSAERAYRDAAWDSRPEVVLHRRCGSTPVVLSAPHAAVQTRNGWPKPADAGTGGLAEALAEASGATVLTVAGIQAGDPNWDITEGEYKRQVRQLLTARPQVLLDLHAMRREHEIDICIGTGRAGDAVTRALAAALADAAARLGLRVAIDWPFAARSPATVTSFVQRLGQRAVQIEINAALLEQHRPAREVGALVEFLLQATVLAAAVASPPGAG